MADKPPVMQSPETDGITEAEESMPKTRTEELPDNYWQFERRWSRRTGLDPEVIRRIFFRASNDFLRGSMYSVDIVGRSLFAADGDHGHMVIMNVFIPDCEDGCYWVGTRYYCPECLRCMVVAGDKLLIHPLAMSLRAKLFFMVDYWLSKFAVIIRLPKQFVSDLLGGWSIGRI
jgi:hypothetical protein